MNLYTDGGLVGSNPSHAGTWAWALVDGTGQLVTQRSGVIRTGWNGLTRITNNVTELLAAVHGLESLPNWQRVTLWTDSAVTACRLRYSTRWNGIPDLLRDRAKRARLRASSVVLLGGHPTRAELAEGSRAGVPVSPWNVYCDQLCRQAAKGVTV